MSAAKLCALSIAACLFATCLPARAADTGDEATALLAKHATYAGWRGGDGKLKTLDTHGTVTQSDGKVVRQIRQLRIGAIERSSLGYVETGFTGRVFWQSNSNGFTTRSVGDEAKVQAAQIQVDDEELSSLPGTVRGHETVAGVRTTVVRVVTLPGLPVDLDIDPDSGAYKRVAIDPGGRYEERYDVLADADVGGGLRVRSAWQYVGESEIYRWTKLEANTDLSAEDLHPPKARATWDFGPPAQTVPINVTENRIYIDAVVNGHTGHFIFDTGAAVTGFTDSFARTVGAKRLGTSGIRGIGGDARANVYTVDTLAFGANVLHNISILTGLDERGNNSERVDGLIGFDLLGGAIVELDLDAQTMRMHDPALVAPDQAQGVTMQVDLSSGTPRVPMTVDGRAPVLATLDSGNAASVLFSSQLVSRDHIALLAPSNVLASRMELVGVNGHEVDDCGMLASVEVGPIAYRPVAACQSNSMENSEILVGFDFIKHFNYVFDYPDGLIVATLRKGG